MRRLLAISFVMLPFVGCAGDDVGSDKGTFEFEEIGKTSQAITVSEIMTRAQEWVDARVPYCGGVRGGTDYICGGTCSRPAAAWDKYRTDCSGFVSWCWQIASNPTTSVYMSDRGGTDGWSTVTIDSMTTGDAVVCDGHIKLFSKFISATSAEIYEEYDCGKVARKAVQSFTRSGNTLKFSGDSRVYHPIRRNSITPSVLVKGYIDKATTTVEGWAVDMNAKSVALGVDIQVDTFHLAAKADRPRPDIASALGVDPNHGYVLETPLYFCDGKAHGVQATAKPASGASATTLTATPKSLECPLPAVLPGVLRHIVNPAAFEAWHFNALAQQRWVSATDAAKYEQVAELPATPELKRTPDGKVWLIDGTLRRHVTSPESFGAWGFDDKAVVAVTDADASKYNEGPELPERPVLIQQVGEPAVFVLDTRVASAPVDPPVDTTPPGSGEKPAGTNGDSVDSDGDGAMKGSCTTNGAHSSSNAGFVFVGLGLALGAGLRRRR